MIKHRRRPVSPFWNYLEARMERAGLSTSDLVRAVGVHRSRLTDWRRGRSVSVETARALAGLFGVPLLEVLVAAGVISADEARAQRLRDAGSVSDDLLLVELRRRLARREQEPG
ncbi:helix-turn-helix domain-containing protein [Saccharothrix variisporea]|uniref:Helix-turn-helix protein n=1 Tax=Saccharothrix variisporea TaxID=543527 RepID=A0A495X533_9PSEU|nr:helix-turn-helix transcriptional regulator [Saccharothrix variisporea]RKT69047.1 helix-turn-helix protein [Saccharothrix variisporea]